MGAFARENSIIQKYHQGPTFFEVIEKQTEIYFDFRVFEKVQVSKCVQAFVVLGFCAALSIRFDFQIITYTAFLYDLRDYYCLDQSDNFL